MDATKSVVEQLAGYRTIDLTTTGRRSGRPARIEIWWFHIDGRFIITGTPGPRDWYANALADPAVVIHTPSGDHAATAVPVTDAAMRRRIMEDPATRWYRSQEELERLVATAPMIEVTLTDPQAPTVRNPAEGPTS